MLRTLHIENVAVIETADVDFGGGLHVLTGETGAGKSIVIDAISAILGERTPARGHPDWRGESLRQCGIRRRAGTGVVCGERRGL